MTLGHYGHPWTSLGLLGDVKKQTSEKPRAIRETRLHRHLCSAARLDEGRQAIPNVRVLVHDLGPLWAFLGTPGSLEDVEKN